MNPFSNLIILVPLILLFLFMVLLVSSFIILAWSCGLAFSQASGKSPNNSCPEGGGSPNSLILMWSTIPRALKILKEYLVSCVLQILRKKLRTGPLDRRSPWAAMA